ncbi:valine--tRNA ligase [Candidatus Azambacteria bacterium RIFCSPLOWO2_01_FULL_37_9]|uniref:Valine--tRNA ligase n=1 Tax=Candidatus Azambacteria bacterium RIFCSPLOWO2_01_FULL_37_9 TaxID=1797297 RepID=A0A1F5C7D5_9BACT|nr:MAG: valine--tRNA ligase [Candidatus Azambacteria bacterium RIFCSPLOWO2_01_FULL_37_9]
MADFTKPYDPQKVENEIYKKWLESGYFNPDNLPVAKSYPSAGGLKAKSYVIMLPPPNVTGSLHMGHALNATIQDILIRKKRMEGYKTLWLPGTDHAGIATQNVVEKKFKKEGISRHDLGREKFLEKVWEWKEEYGNKILDQLKRIGASCDWSRTRFTMDDNYRKAVEEAFLHYYKKGLIYQGERVINWCKRCQTSLSDLELEHEEEKGKLYFIKYPIVKNSKLQDYIIVATTRPETMLGDTAVAVNPNDERYKDLVGKKLILPIVNREIPIISDDAIEKEFGTGAVKVTPNHSIIDSEIADRHNLPRVTIINAYGKMTDDAGKYFAGLSTQDAREKVVAELEKQNLIEKIEERAHRVAKCYRCASVIEPQPSKQWFLKMNELAEKTKKAIEDGNVRFNNERWKKISLDWLSSIRDWCISRQIWWGHRLPVWFCQNQTGISNSQFLISKQFKNKNLFDEHSVVSIKQPKECPFCDGCQMKQSEDVLDTWFSSALWPFATLGWPDKETKDLKEFYPTQVLSTARDIINLWVLRMIFSSIEFMDGQMPFAKVIIHPTVLAKSGQRMSKSLGTGVDPLDLIEKYGADATRFGLIYQMMGNQDMKFEESHLLAGKKFANKLWNISRFVLQKTGDNFYYELPKENDPKSGNYDALDGHEGDSLLKKLSMTIEYANKDIDNFDFGQALHTIYDFVWHDFADKYIEESKSKDTNDVKIVLSHTLINILKLLHPFMPFITEEIWSELPIKDKKLLIVSNWSNN